MEKGEEEDTEEEREEEQHQKEEECDAATMAQTSTDHSTSAVLSYVWCTVAMASEEVSKALGELLQKLPAKDANNE
eukprot:2928695-Pyramimonas_sp.AAC.1